MFPSSLLSRNQKIILKLQLSQELENDENQNENNIDARDVKFTIKSNETNYQMNVRTGMANYKCKFLGKQEVDGKVGFTVFSWIS